ncbi:hypothetical protein L226DRAFT_308776 [Lentinus tigrinus ALCF2SS1-7]|uniref:uncharacterized protein n=1 Tax=Lentinus tigrinus ALCF2SS1-7 TaxID=1328758 RepID=UPI00116620ED|nr:hypothetical protein L226DRAFT_308776 [Lentinus tigrinus ALCF2SS1-7]
MAQCYVPSASSGFKGSSLVRRVCGTGGDPPQSSRSLPVTRHASVLQHCTGTASDARIFFLPALFRLVAGLPTVVSTQPKSARYHASSYSNILRICHCEALRLLSLHLISV